MAVMFPDSAKTRIIFASGAEEVFYNTCRDHLPENWRVYYSRTLSRIETKEGLVDNEIDFVVYHPHFGVVVVEVKGGRIRFDAQSATFFSVNRHDESFPIKNPFQQALVWKSRFLRVLQKMNIRVPITQAVCLPSVGEEELPAQAGIEPSIVIGRTRIRDLEATLKDIVQKAHPPKFLEFNDVSKELDELLAGSAFVTRLYLRDYIDSHELRVKDIEAIHESLITPIFGAKRLGIEGEAGTGKTMLALMLARLLRDQGKKVLLFSSNPLLNLHLKKEAGAKVDVATYSEVAASFGVDLAQPPPDFKGDKNDWIQLEGPERLRKAIEGSEKRYDALLCDEAQDVQPFWWVALEKLLQGGEDDRFYVFFDRSQGVFGSGGSDKNFVPEETLSIAPPYFPLVHNYRTTREIATFSRSFRTGKAILQSHCGRLGYVPEIVTYDNAEDGRRALGGLIRKLFRDETLTSQEVTILSARNPIAPGSILNGVSEIARYPMHVMSPERHKDWKAAFAPKGSVAVASITGFKGLETKVGILVNISEYNLPIENPIMASLIYVACTRAKHMLYILIQQNDPKRSVFEKAIGAIKTTGAMVLEGSSADFEFVGTVSHYNPDRVGWLSVDDPAFQKSSIMFFPFDVTKEGLEDIKPGVKVRFRPRVEGYATIACDLKRA